MIIQTLLGNTQLPRNVLVFFLCRLHSLLEGLLLLSLDSGFLSQELNLALRFESVVLSLLVDLLELGLQFLHSYDVSGFLVLSRFVELLDFVFGVLQAGSESLDFAL
ncbi:hypothetical protein HG530_004687 [Fusarium avenaceum]|nr:hypothetical protein HG530_004687 [Fusarium avenaceum]